MHDRNHLDDDTKYYLIRTAKSMISTDHIPPPPGPCCPGLAVGGPCCYGLLGCAPCRMLSGGSARSNSDAAVTPIARLGMFPDRGGLLPAKLKRGYRLIGVVCAARSCFFSGLICVTLSSVFTIALCL